MTRRSAQVAETLRQVITDALLREVRDPRVGMVTVTSVDVTGDLSLHGVTKSITFPAKLAMDGEAVKVSADFAINRKDFGIVYAGKADDLIADNVAIVLDLTAKK